MFEGHDQSKKKVTTRGPQMKGHVQSKKHQGHDQKG